MYALLFWIRKVELILDFLGSWILDGMEGREVELFNECVPREGLVGWYGVLMMFL